MLDEQSGESKSGKNKTEKGTGGIWQKGTNLPCGPEHGDSGGASRFFKCCKQDDFCLLCFTPRYDIMKVCQDKNKSAQSVKKSGKNMNQTTEHIAPLNAEELLVEKLVPNVRSAGNLCHLCGTHIAHALVKIKNSDFNKQEFIAGVDYITEFKRNILIQNLVSFAELWENIDIIPTTQSLCLLFGSVQNAIKDYTPEKDNALTRFRYTSKASKSERNMGCEGLEIKQTTGGGGTNNTEDDVCGKYGSIKSAGHNHHPTVKPLALMEYLCKITMTPTGGIVLDPFAGSGTTLIAAKMLGRPYIGIEKESEYIAIANARLKGLKIQDTLL